MSHTYYSAIDIFTAQIEVPAQQETVEPVSLSMIIVITRSYSDEYFPQTPLWGIDFIGDLSEFHDEYLARITCQASVGSIDRALLRIDESLRRLVLRRLVDAQPLTAKALWERGYRAYAWAEQHYVHITPTMDLIRFQQHGQWLYGSRIMTDEDAAQLIKQSYQVKRGGGKPTGALFVDKVKLGIPHKVGEDTLEIHRKVGSATLKHRDIEYAGPDRRGVKALPTRH